MFNNNIYIHCIKFIKLLGGLSMASLLTACIGGVDSRVTDADNNDVLFIGDSIYALSGEIQDNLEEEAGQTFLRYAKSGAQLFNGFAGIQTIPDQFEEAIEDNPGIKTVVMNGGGNDILIPAVLLDPYRCKTRWYHFGRLRSSCKEFIDGLYVQGLQVIDEFTKYESVSNIIYLGYYYTKFGLAGNLALLEEAVDYGDATLSRACDVSPIPCFFVDPRDEINNSDILFDGIHPTTSGSEKMADLIWPALEPLL